jgi:predicted PurR-regulated permease PerM
LSPGDDSAKPIVDMAEEPIRTPPALSSPYSIGAFVSRLLLIALFLLIGLVLWRLQDALLVAFGAIILAVGFHGVADTLSRRTKLPAPAALALVVLVPLGVIVVSFEIFGATMVVQYGELTQKLPASVKALAGWFNASPLGRDLVTQGRTAIYSAASASGPRLLAGLVGGLGQAFTYALVMVVCAVFLALDPDRYRNDFLALMPRAKRARYAEVLSATAHTLRRWLFGRLIVMAAIGLMSGLGLWALGIDSPFALGLTGAILTFIPNLGAVMAALPGMLIGFLQEPMKAVVVALLFMTVHFIEGNFITPFVQNETVDIPPVISIFSTLVFALLLGPVGVFLAAPITVVLMVLVNHLYIEDVLGDQVAARKHARIRLPRRRRTTRKT